MNDILIGQSVLRSSMVEEAITQLGVGEALVSTLQEGGVPPSVERAMIVPPTCRIGAITDAERATTRSRSPVSGKYDTPIDRESAYEILTRRTSAQAAESAPSNAAQTAPAPAAQGSGWGQSVHDAVFGTNRRQGMIEALAKSAARNAGSQLGRSLLRGLLGSILRK